MGFDLNQVCGPKWLCCKARFPEPSDDAHGQQPSSRANSKDYYTRLLVS